MLLALYSTIAPEPGTGDYVGLLALLGMTDAEVAPSAEAQFVERSGTVYQASGTPGMVYASFAIVNYNLTGTLPLIWEVFGVPGDVEAEAPFEEGTPTVFQPSGTAGETTVDAPFVERTPTVYEATGTPGGYEAEVSLVEHAPAVLNATGVPGSAAAEAPFVTRTAMVFAPLGNAMTSASAPLVTSSPTPILPQGVVGMATADSAFVTRTAVVFSASGSGTATGSAPFVSRRTVVWNAVASEIGDVPFHAGTLVRSDWRGALLPSSWSATMKED